MIFNIGGGGGGSKVKPGTSLPVMDGIPYPGSAEEYSRSDHVHPKDTTGSPLSPESVATTRALSDIGNAVATTAWVEQRLAELLTDDLSSLQGTERTSGVTLTATVQGHGNLKGAKVKLVSYTDLGNGSGSETIVGLKRRYLSSSGYQDGDYICCTSAGGSGSRASGWYARTNSQTGELTIRYLPTGTYRLYYIYDELPSGYYEVVNPYVQFTVSSTDPSVNIFLSTIYLKVRCRDSRKNENIQFPKCSVISSTNNKMIFGTKSGSYNYYVDNPSNPTCDFIPASSTGITVYMLAEDSYRATIIASNKCGYHSPMTITQNVSTYHTCVIDAVPTALSIVRKNSSGTAISTSNDRYQIKNSDGNLVYVYQESAGVYCVYNADSGFTETSTTNTTLAPNGSTLYIYNLPESETYTIECTTAPTGYTSVDTTKFTVNTTCNDTNKQVVTLTAR